MNFKLVGKYLGRIVLAEALVLLPSCGIAMFCGEFKALFALLLTAAICLACWLFLYIYCRKEKSPVHQKEGFALAALVCVVVSFFGALPFFLSGEIPNFIDALFESTSGFTSTGASIIEDLEKISRSLIFWRSFTHWLGGIGILAFILAVVQAKKGAGFSMMLLQAERNGPQSGLSAATPGESVRALFVVYMGLSAINLGLLLGFGMPVFDAFCTMFGTAGTGGFSIKNDSMASYAPALQNITTLFMAVYGVNFALYHLLLRRQWRKALKDEELHLYFGVMAAAVLVIGFNLYSSNFYGIYDSLRHSAFTVSSIMTTCGFTSTDFDLWPQFSRSLILILMLGGSMSGSTGGGFKMARILIMIKGLKVGLYRLLHPRGVKNMQINGRPMGEEVLARNYVFLELYCFLCVAIFLCISLDGLSMEANLAATLSCFNNVGLGFGEAGPMLSYSAYSNFSTGVLTLSMLLGRLEIFPILLLFFPSTWQQKNG